jgi:hypothetical protein
MAAGLGFKTFTTGEVLTSADTNGYLMQGVLVFASAAARDAAITSPQEGQFAYLKDTNVTTYYTGSAWANLDTTGMTNPMTTTGDTIYSSSGSTPARLGIGSTGNVLTVAGGVPTWAAPSAGATSSYTLLNTGGTALTGASTITVSGISGQQKLMIIVQNTTSTNANAGISVRFNTDSGSNYRYSGFLYFSQSAYAADNLQNNNGDPADKVQLLRTGAAAAIASASVFIDGCNSTGIKAFQTQGGASPGASNGNIAYVAGGVYTGSSTISSVSVVCSSGNFNAGNIFVYGSAV